MSRIDHLILSKELNCTLLQSMIADVHMNDALTAPSCGAEKDYERLEYLGELLVVLS
jgi:endoribonuclease Dicer